MSREKKKVRELFRTSVFERDSWNCRVCKGGGVLDAHHITNREAMPAGGYVAENGITLCAPCHVKAEKFYETGTAVEGFSPNDLYFLIGSSYDKAYQASLKLKE